MSLSVERRAVLEAVCDTVVPALERPDDPEGFWARSAGDVGAPAALEALLELRPPEEQLGIDELLDGLAQSGFLSSSRRSREQILRNIAALTPAAAAGIQALTGLTLFLTYGAPDPVTGGNPFWSVFAYPGAGVVPAPEAPRAITPLVPEGDELKLDADAVVIGSGAGGGVIAASLAEAGLEVVVLEASGYYDETQFNGYELWAYQNMYWRGGPQPTADLNMTLQAGATLGGGTTINWTNCLRTRPWVREQWAREHGLTGVDGPEFDTHLDAVFERLSVNDRCSDLNGTQQRMKAGAEALGWSFRTILRNIDESRYDPASAGYIGFGDRSGAKQTTTRTYLADAAGRGAEFVVDCFVDRILTEGGRASGVEGTYFDPATGRRAHVSVRAPRVVVAAGSLESPALLLRSGIGGPATGQNLHLHPCTAVFGSYGEDQRAWWGAPQAGLVDEFAAVEDDHGFLLEATQYALGIGASALPFTTGEEHKELMHRFRYGATFIGLVRDRGVGQVTVDADGQAVPWYSISDELDVRNSKRAIEAQIRLHHAGGAGEIMPLATGMPRWRPGDDLERFIERCQRIPLRAGGYRLFSAHQMGTCRMGKDSATSVAGPEGELHDTPGVWIGDASAFPTSSGTNPMITIMALARRTGEAIKASSPATAAATQS
jgi:choline dehydrogenase-like flavoprotein